LRLFVYFGTTVPDLKGIFWTKRSGIVKYLFVQIANAKKAIHRKGAENANREEVFGLRPDACHDYRTKITLRYLSAPCASAVEKLLPS
jgi:hypothetical protein